MCRRRTAPLKPRIDLMLRQYVRSSAGLKGLAASSRLLDDRPTQRHHEVRHLAIDLPFLSTLAADIKVHVQPQLTGVLNGVAFTAKGRALPFAEQRAATTRFQAGSVGFGTLRAL